MEIKSGLAPIIFLENGILCTEIQEPLLLKNQKSSLSSEYLCRQERTGRRPELWSVDENWTGLWSGDVPTRQHSASRAQSTSSGVEFQDAINGTEIDQKKYFQFNFGISPSWLPARFSRRENHSSPKEMESDEDKAAVKRAVRTEKREKLRQFLDHSTESHMATSKVQHDKGYSSQLHPLFNSSTKGIQ
nr:hypothetical protein Iba_chr05bCG3270 [Ipomoea batatas]